jgi:hypothetical protein
VDDVIIRRLISHITDLKLLIHEKSYKTYDKELKRTMVYINATEEKVNAEYRKYA